jgi:hypothetical protein
VCLLPVFKRGERPLQRLAIPASPQEVRTGPETHDRRAVGPRARALTMAQLYLRPRPEEVVARLLEHQRTRKERAVLAPPAGGYSADVLEAPLGGGIDGGHVDPIATLQRGAPA